MNWTPLITFALIVVDALVVFAFLFALHKAFQHRPHFTIFVKPSKKVLTLRDSILKERWRKITRNVDYGSAESMKLALIEADKMADDVLKRLGFSGHHMADRIQQMEQDEFKTVKRIWAAHRYRNNIVHTSNFQVRVDEVRKILEDYRAFLHEVGVI